MDSNVLLLYGERMVRLAQKNKGKRQWKMNIICNMALKQCQRLLTFVTNPCIDTVLQNQLNLIEKLS